MNQNKTPSTEEVTKKFLVQKHMSRLVIHDFASLLRKSLLCYCDTFFEFPLFQDHSTSPESSGVQMDSRKTITEPSSMTDADFLVRSFSQLKATESSEENTNEIVVSFTCLWLYSS